MLSQAIAASPLNLNVQLEVGGELLEQGAFIESERVLSSVYMRAPKNTTVSKKVLELLEKLEAQKVKSDLEDSLNLTR